MKKLILFFLLAMCMLCSSLFATANDGEHDAISLNMPNLSVIEALQMLAKVTGENLVIRGDVQGFVNLFLHDISSEEAWSALLKTANLTLERQGNLLFISPLAVEEEEELVTRVVQLQHITLGTDQTSNQGGLRGGSTQIGQTGGRGTQEDVSFKDILDDALGDEALQVGVDARTNQVVLTGSKDVVDRALLVIETLDRPIPQILIEAKVVQAREKALKDLGIDWGGVYAVRSGGDFNYQSDRGRSTAITKNISENLTYSSTLNEFSVALSAMEEKGDARVLFSPRVVTQNNKEAFISSGQEIQVPSGLDINGNSTFRDRQVTLELGVTPRVLSNRMISLNIRLRNDSINYEQQQISGVPPLDVNSVEGFVTLQDNDTVILGGILTSQETDQLTRVPILADIPLLGLAFQKKRKQMEQTELIVLLTPRIITDQFGVLLPDSARNAMPSDAQSRVIERLSNPHRVWELQPPLVKEK